MPEPTTRGWVAEEARRAERILVLCRDRQAATVDDVEELAASVLDLVRESARLHGVIRDCQARQGGGSCG